MAKPHQEERNTKSQSASDGQGREQTQRSGQQQSGRGDQQQRTGGNSGTAQKRSTEREGANHPGTTSGPGRETAAGDTSRSKPSRDTKEPEGFDEDTDAGMDNKDPGYEKPGRRDETKHNPNRAW